MTTQTTSQRRENLPAKVTRFIGRTAGAVRDRAGHGRAPPGDPARARRSRQDAAGAAPWRRASATRSGRRLLLVELSALRNPELLARRGSQGARAAQRVGRTTRPRRSPAAGRVGAAAAPRHLRAPGRRLRQPHPRVLLDSAPTCASWRPAGSRSASPGEHVVPVPPLAADVAAVRGRRAFRRPGAGGGARLRAHPGELRCRRRAVPQARRHTAGHRARGGAAARRCRPRRSLSPAGRPVPDPRDLPDPHRPAPHAARGHRLELRPVQSGGAAAVGASCPSSSAASPRRRPRSSAVLAPARRSPGWPRSRSSSPGSGPPRWTGRSPARRAATAARHDAGVRRRAGDRRRRRGPGAGQAPRLLPRPGRARGRGQRRARSRPAGWPGPGWRPTTCERPSTSLRHARRGASRAAADAGAAALLADARGVHRGQALARAGAGGRPGIARERLGQLRGRRPGRAAGRPRRRRAAARPGRRAGPGPSPTENLAAHVTAPRGRSPSTPGTTRRRRPSSSTALASFEGPGSATRWRWSAIAGSPRPAW